MKNFKAITQERIEVRRSAKIRNRSEWTTFQASLIKTSKSSSEEKFKRDSSIPQQIHQNLFHGPIFRSRWPLRRQVTTWSKALNRARGRSACLHRSVPVWKTCREAATKTGKEGNKNALSIGCDTACIVFSLVRSTVLTYLSRIMARAFASRCKKRRAAIYPVIKTQTLERAAQLTPVRPRALFISPPLCAFFVVPDGWLKAGSSTIFTVAIKADGQRAMPPGFAVS